jgi:hypothetical protein
MTGRRVITIALIILTSCSNDPTMTSNHSVFIREDLGYMAFDIVPDHPL